MKHILIVDDEPEQLRSFRAGLKIRGYKTMEALTAQSALQQLHDHGDKVALVLTDYLMPGMDGLSLLREIRRVSEALPVIVMSAHGCKSLITDVLRAGCDGFLEKPFALDELIEEVKRIAMTRDATRNSTFSASAGHGFEPAAAHPTNGEPPERLTRVRERNGAMD